MDQTPCIESVRSWSWVAGWLMSARRPMSLTARLPAVDRPPSEQPDRREARDQARVAHPRSASGRMVHPASSPPGEGTPPSTGGPSPERQPSDGPPSEQPPGVSVKTRGRRAIFPAVSVHAIIGPSATRPAMERIARSACRPQRRGQMRISARNLLPPGTHALDRGAKRPSMRADRIGWHHGCPPGLSTTLQGPFLMLSRTHRGPYP